MKRLARLFWELFKIALFVVGGGYAILVVAEDVFARRLKWTEEGELLEKLPVFQMVPGLIAGNIAIYLGMKVAGRIGAAVGLSAVALPSLIIFLAVSMGYGFIPVGDPLVAGIFLGLRAALTGVIVATLVRSWRNCVKGARGYAVLALAVVALTVLKINPALVILGGMVVGVSLNYLPRGAHCSLGVIPLIFMKYGLLCFGGGFVLVPMYLDEFVGAAAPLLQLPPEEFSNLMALTQMTPGPIAVNAATFFGYRLAGIPGSILATVSLLLPSFFLLTWVLRSLERWRENRFVQGLLTGVRPVTAAMLISAAFAFAGLSVWTVGEGGALRFNPLAILLVCAVAVAMLRTKLKVTRLLLLSSLAGLLAAWLA